VAVQRRVFPSTWFVPMPARAIVASVQYSSANSWPDV
jgi:hypothetical protein